MSDQHPHDTERLISAMLDRVLTADEAGRLSAHIERGEDLGEYLDWVIVDTFLRRTLGSIQAPAPHRATAQPQPPAPVRWRTPHLLAAAILLAACGFAIYLASGDPQSEIRNPQSTTASVLDVVAGTLMVDNQIASPGEAYTGRELALDGGEAEFMLPSQVAVRLRGATRMTIHDAMNVTMAHGAAEFDCPPRAKGYTVHLPGGARVVDLGTRFRVNMDRVDVGRVAVTEGKVRVEWFDADGAPRSTTVPAGVSVQLTPGDEGRVAVSILPATRLKLVGDPDHSTPTKVGSVADTIDDPFAYDPLSPTSPMPVLVYHDPTHGYHGYHAYQPEGADVVLSYTLDPVTLSADQTLVIDLYGRDISLRRDKNIDIHLYRGGYDDTDCVATAKGLSIPESPRHLRVSSRDFGVELTGVSFDRIRIVGHDSDGDPGGSYFTLLEVCAAVLRAPTSDAPTEPTLSGAAPAPSPPSDGHTHPPSP